MPCYENGKIYRLDCLNTGETYIGSTTRSLTERLAEHVRKCKQLNRITSHKVIEGGNYRIELIELFPCETKEQLNAREGYFIRTNKCVNKVTPGRTKEEHYKDNHEHFKTYRETHKDEKKAYNEKHKDEIKAYHRAYREKHSDKIKSYYELNKETLKVEMKVYRAKHSDELKAYHKAYRDQHSDKIKAYYEHHKTDKKTELQKKSICFCGGKHTKANRSIHLKTKKHLDFVQEILAS